MLMLILICVACFAYLAWYRNRPSRGPPILPDAWPLIGHAPVRTLDHSRLWELMELVSKMSLDAGGAVTLLLGPKIVYVLTDPEDCLTVSNCCLAKSDFYDYAKPWLGEGLITAKVPIWKHHRKLLNPAFSQQVLDKFLGVFNAQARRLVKSMEVEVGRGPFDHWPYLALNGLETICLTALGLEISAEEDQTLNKQYFHALEKIFHVIIERVTKVWLHWDLVYRWTKLKKKENRLIEVLHNMSSKVLKRRKEELRHDNNTEFHHQGSKFKPFLDLLLELADKSALTDLDIREHVDTMIVAGHDTSANSLMYTLVLLGSHPEVQTKVYEEVITVLGLDRDADKHDISRLLYTEAVLKESLRLYPIFPVVTRAIDKEVKIKNYTLDPGNLCFMMLYGIHRHPSWGADANQFRPERWFETLPENPGAFAGFSIGRRGCIGKNYAMMSMKTALAHVIRNYCVTADQTKLILKLGVMLKPVSGHHLTLERRPVKKL